MTEVSASQTIEKIKTHFREAFVGHADPGVPLKNLCTAVLLRKAGTRCVLFRRTLV